MINKINIDGVDHDIISESAERKIAETKEKLENLVVNDLTTGGADKALSAEMGKELEKNIHPFIIGSDKVNRCVLELYIYPERHEGHELKLTTCYKPDKAITFVIDNNLNNQVKGYNIGRVGDIDLFELRSLINNVIYGYCLIDWSRLSINGPQGSGAGIANINYTSYFHINTVISKYLSDAEMNNIDVEVNTQAKVLQDVLTKIDSEKVNIEAGAVNYLDGTSISLSVSFRSVYIPVSDGKYKLQITSPLDINKVYVVKYNNNKYVGYSLESSNSTIVVDESFNQIRVRVDCMSEVIDSDIQNSTIIVLHEDNIYNYINEQLYISRIGNPLFESSVDFTYPGFIDLSTSKYVSAAVEFGTSDYIGVFPGQTVSVTFAGYGNCGIAGFLDKQGGGFVPVVKLPTDASQKPRTETFIIPDNVYYIRISSIIAAVPVGKIEYITLCNISILAEILSMTFSDGSDVERIFKGLTELSLYKLSCSGITNDYQGFRLNFNIPDDDDKIILSTDILNTNFHNATSINELIKAFAPVLFYKMQKVGCFVLYDIEKQNRPFIYDVDGNKKYLTLTNE